MKRLFVVLMSVLCGVAYASDTEDISIADLGWMAGHWVGNSKNVQSEEFWAAPAGGMMVGLHREVRGARSAFFEYLRIEATERGLTYIASPKGTGTTEFVLVSISDQFVAFENLEHDYPQRITYEREGNRLTAWISGIQGGVIMSDEWSWDLVE
jgi:uncharacterized protein YfiM (DUF2279 family)